MAEHDWPKQRVVLPHIFVLMILNLSKTSGFQEYLETSKTNMFVLDLSQCSLIECVSKMCEIKSRAHPNIKRDYSVLVNHLRAIEIQYNCTLMPSMISSVFWLYFVPYLSDKGLKYSTIRNIKINLITVLNWSSKYGVKLNPSYCEVNIPKYVPYKIALTPDEISHIYHYKITQEETYNLRLKRVQKLFKNKVETLKHVRDMFVLGCNLGQRYSDLRRISPENFKNGVFSIVQQKTGNKCHVPISTMSIDSRITFAILEKYNYHAPYTGSICCYNGYIHQLLHMIGEEFVEDIYIDNKVNGVIIREVKKRYEMISSHSARRTFATINTLRDIPRSKILRATGHSTEQAFNRYICYGEAD